MVVSEIISASSVPSNPTTAISSGTRSPTCCMARSAPCRKGIGHGKYRVRRVVLQQILHAAMPALELRSWHIPPPDNPDPAGGARFCNRVRAGGHICS